MYNVRVSGNQGIEDEYWMEGSAGGRGVGMMCQDGYVRNVGNMVTLAVDNVK